MLNVRRVCLIVKRELYENGVGAIVVVLTGGSASGAIRKGLRRWSRVR